MILAIDVGNTNIVIGGIDDEKIVFMARTATDRTKTEDQYGIQIKNILELYDINARQLEGSIISSVVPPISRAVSAAVQMVSGIKPMIVGPGLKTGLNILMDNPASVGSDLIVNAIAALEQWTPPIIIIDMGTATTISVVDKNRNYIGGCIMPGVLVSLDALSSMAAQLPHISLEDPKKAIGKNTIDCMRSGVVYGNAAMLDGYIDRIEEELGEKANVVATGGLSKGIVPYCKKTVHYSEELLLKGLYIVYKKNK